MRSLRIESIGISEIYEAPEPVVQEADVLLKINHVGLCGTDLSTFSGLNPNVALPRIPGHEIGAEVLYCGPNASGSLSPGDRVVVVPYTACGGCTSCRKGRINACRYNKTLGVQQDGALAERFAWPATKLIPNKTLQPRDLALVEPLAVGFHAVERGRVQPEDTVVVLGCGVIGLGAIAGAVARGANVVAVDVSESKASLACTLGASCAVIGKGEEVIQEILRITNGDGADVVIEAVGLPETYTLAIDLVSFAGRVVYVGYTKEIVSYKTQVFNLKELDIHGSRNATEKDFFAVIKYLEALGDETKIFVSMVLPIEKANQALPYWASNRNNITKIIIEM